MDSKGGNPFLMDDYGTESSNETLTSQASNPFLQDFADAETAGVGENPFLNFAGDQSYQPSIGADSTNPFASFVADAAASSTTDTPAADMFTSQTTNVFATPGEESSADLLDAADSTQPPEDIFGQPTASTVPVLPAQPALPDLPAGTGGTGEAAEAAASAQAKNGKMPPSRPPPPRPQPPPPPKNTKDLILSVTGAMDATSNHLLDRLQVKLVDKLKKYIIAGEIVV